MTSVALWLYRWRRTVCAAYVIGAAALVPFINLTRINNDLDAWFSRDDPLYRDYARFRAEWHERKPPEKQY